MEDPLRSLLAQHKLAHFADALEGIGLCSVADIELVEDDDLSGAGMKAIQIRSFHRMRESMSLQSAPPSVQPHTTSIPQSRSSCNRSAAGAPTASEDREKSDIGTDNFDAAKGTEEKTVLETQNSSYCVLLDGANIMRSQVGGSCSRKGSNGTKIARKDNPRQLRLAYDWFGSRLPSCKVKIFLYGCLETHLREDPHLKSILADIVWTPSRADVDKFMLQTAAQGIDQLPAIIVTNDCFDKFLGMDVGGKIINADWVNEHTLKYVMASEDTFSPSILPQHPLSSLCVTVTQNICPPPLIATADMMPTLMQQAAQEWVVNVSGPRGAQPHHLVRVSPTSPATLRCPRGCELQLQAATSESFGTPTGELELIAVSARKKSVRLFVMAENGQANYHCFCPKCDAYMEFRIVQGPEADAANQRKEFAFVGSLWVPPSCDTMATLQETGSELDQRIDRYCLAAFVLGHSLDRVGSCHDRILLCTPEASKMLDINGWASLLRLVGWALIVKDQVKVAEKLINECRPKFHGSFFKLQALSLEQYVRVALIDLDMLALKNVDHLADSKKYPSPMAVARVNRLNREVLPGEVLVSRDFFDDSGNQRYGINAGLVILETSTTRLQDMMTSIQDAANLSHMASKGPEQDFLTRYHDYRECWHHLDTRYNFQLHQLSFVHASDTSDRRRLPYDDVHMLHFSAEPKPFDYFFQKGTTEPSFDEFALGTFKGSQEWAQNIVKRASKDWYEAFTDAWQMLLTKKVPLLQECPRCQSSGGEAKHLAIHCPDLASQLRSHGFDPQLVQGSFESTRDIEKLLQPPQFRLCVSLVAAAQALFASAPSPVSASREEPQGVHSASPKTHNSKTAAENDTPVSAKDLWVLPVATLKAKLKAAGIDTKGCLEKTDLVCLAVQHAAVMKASSDGISNCSAEPDSDAYGSQSHHDCDQGSSRMKAMRESQHPISARMGDAAHCVDKKDPVTDANCISKQAGQEPVQRRVLPVRDNTVMIDSRRDEIMSALQRHKVVIIVSSTGSGKSTVVPRMIVEECHDARVACTQPRRIAAASLARRVAKLWKVDVGGEEVGYQVGGCSMMHENKTRLVFMVTAIAMLQLLQSGFAYTHLVIDEVHERSIFIDILLTLVKSELLPSCTGLRVVLMSAAMDAQRILTYFKSAGMDPCLLDLQAPPKHEVRCQLLDQINFFKRRPVPVLEVANGKDIGDFILYLHRNREYKASFLVFLAGKADVQKVFEHLLASRESSTIAVKPVYGGMSIESQIRILGSCGGGNNVRNVILATDVIESSVTIPDVSVVIDTLLHKRRRWDENRSESPLTVELISRDEAKQRRGRTGRTGPGEVFQLVNKKTFESLREHAIPQIWSDRLEEMLLMLYEQQSIADPRAFLKLMPDPPEQMRVDVCIRRFLELNAMEKDVTTKRPVPTHFGQFLKFLPLDPEVGNLVMNGLRYGVIEECVIVAAVHQRGEPFIEDPALTPQQALILLNIRKACTGKLPSDLITGLMGYRAWRRKLEEQDPKAWKVEDEIQWCAAHFLSLSKLHELEELRVQIFDALCENGYHAGVRDDEKELMRRRRRQKEKLDAAIGDASRPLFSQEYSAKAADDFHRLLAPEHQNVDKRRLLHWCLCAAFLHGVLECENLDRVHEIKFDPWEALAAERFAEQKDWIMSYLRRLGFAVASARTGKEGDVFVKFTTQEDARLALQVCSMVGTDKQVPFRRCYKWGPKIEKVNHRAWCSADCKIAQTSLASFPQDSQVTVVAAEFLPIQSTNSMFYLCTKCSIVPNGLLALVILATYHAAELRDLGDQVRVRARFFGCTESLSFSKPSDGEGLELVQSIRSGMDEEFHGSGGSLHPDECRSIVAKRQAQVLQLMGLLEAANPPFVAGRESGLPSRANVTSRFSAPKLRDLFAGGNFADFDVDEDDGQSSAEYDDCDDF